MVGQWAQSSVIIASKELTPCCSTSGCSLLSYPQHWRDAAPWKHHLEQQQLHGSHEPWALWPVFTALAPPGKRRAMGKQQGAERTLQGAPGAWLFFVII